MRPAGPLLLLLTASPACLTADGPTEASPSQTSARLSQEIRATLPKFSPPPPQPPPVPASAPAAPRDPDVLELPTMTVRAKHAPRIDPLDLLTKPAREKQRAVDFKNSLKGLDAILNGFSIPILSPSMAERGWRAEQARQLQDLNDIANLVRALDPAAAADLKQVATEAKRAIEQQDRPAGGK